MANRDYPAWVCMDCGKKYGRKLPSEGTTWNHGTCGVCCEDDIVTEPRDFGHLRDGWEEEIVSENTSSNVRVIGGNVRYRRFAYLHKGDYSRFGLLEAVDHRDARNHLGSGFYIRKTWLTPEEVYAQAFDRDRKWEIVSSIFSHLL